MSSNLQIYIIILKIIKVINSVLKVIFILSEVLLHCYHINHFISMFEVIIYLIQLQLSNITSILLQIKSSSVQNSFSTVGIIERDLIDI